MGGVREEAKERARAQLCRLGSPPLAVDKERGRGHQRRHLFFFFTLYIVNLPLYGLHSGGEGFSSIPLARTVWYAGNPKERRRL